MSSNRRDFIKFVVAGAVASGCPIDQALFAAPAAATPTVEGEENKICHQVRDGKVFTRPPVTANHVSGAVQLRNDLCSGGKLRSPRNAVESLSRVSELR